MATSRLKSKMTRPPPPPVPVDYDPYEDFEAVIPISRARSSDSPRASSQKAASLQRSKPSSTRATALPPMKRASPRSRAAAAVSQARAPSAAHQPPRQEQIPLRLSRDNPSRPTGVVKHNKAMAIPKRLERKNSPAPSDLKTQARPVAQPAAATTAPSAPTKKPSAPTRTMPQPTTSAKRRKRLIDTLVALKESSSEGEEEESQCQDDPAVSHHSESSLASFDLGPAAGLPAATPAKVTAVVRAMSGATKPGPRITYGMARTTVLEEEDVIMGGLDFGALANASSTKAPLLSLARPKPPPNAFSFEDDEDTANTGQVRSIHELRQAGATNRYADEMADFEDRVGVPSAKPSSIRRGALLEIAERMHEKEFRKQFRMHGSKIFFERLAQETDIVAAYAIVAILTTLFGTQSSAHLIQQTAFHGIAELLALLLHRPEHVRSIARDRKNNLSKNAQKSMNELEEAVLKLPIWRPATPTLLSPRTLALKCLELMMRQCTDARIETKIFSAAVTDHLFSVLTQAVSDASFWDFPTRHQSTDLYLALVLLEPLSLGAMQSELGPTWTAEYVPIVADVLKTALDRPVDKFDELENLVLRLVLNSTNNNTSACGMFVRKGLLRRLTETACRSFQSVLTSIKDDAFMAKVLESLVFMLGVLINFCEHYPPAAQDLADATTESESGDQPPVHRLIRVFLDYYSKTSDADSMEKSQLNVAFGYLSVALGYLCLHRDVRDAFESVHSKRTLAPLVDAVREFMRYHQLLAANAMDAGHAEEARQHSPATQRLERLVGQLEQCH